MDIHDSMYYSSELHQLHLKENVPIVERSSTNQSNTVKTAQNCTNYAKEIITLTQQDDRQMNGNPVFADGILENTNDIHYENIKIKLKQTLPQHQMCHMSIRMRI